MIFTTLAPDRATKDVTHGQKDAGLAGLVGSEESLLVLGLISIQFKA